jgi:type III pantothenate kinase
MSVTRILCSCIVIDFGTANTIDAINANGEYLGGAITLGIRSTCAALVQAAARLIKVDLKPPENVVGRNTVDAIRSGLIYGGSTG